jgi:LEA14-like dessication related protein
MTRFTARDAAAFLLCLYCAACKTLQQQAFREPDVIVDTAALAGGIQSRHFELDLAIYNPNRYRLDASRIRYRLVVDSIDIASGTIERRVTLPPRGTASVRAPVDVEERALPTVLMSAFANRGSVSFHLAGDMRIETTFGSVTRPFEQRGTYELLTGRITIFKRK